MNLSELLNVENRSLARKTKPKTLNSKIQWPDVPVQEQKKYIVVTSLEGLEECFDHCKRTGYCSFDWETAPSDEERDRWNEELADLMDQRDVFEDEVNSAKNSSSIMLYKSAKKLLDEFDKQIDEKELFFKYSPLDPHRAKICTCSICPEPHVVYVFFLCHTSGSRHFLMEKSREEALQIFLTEFERSMLSNTEIEKIAYNLSFETKMSLKYGIYIRKPASDPFILIVRTLQVVDQASIMNPKTPAAGKGLKKMTAKYLQVQMNDFKEVVENSGNEFFDELSTDDETAVIYSAEDSDYSLQLFLYFKEVADQIKIERNEVKYATEIIDINNQKIKNTTTDFDKPYATYFEWLHEIEMPFARVIGQMEYHGFTWNEEKAAQVKKEAEVAMEKAVEKIRNIGKKVYKVFTDKAEDENIKVYLEPLLNINPGKTGKNESVRFLLFDVLGCPVPSISDKTDKPNMDHSSILDMIFMVNHNLTEIDDEKYLDSDIDISQFNESERTRISEIRNKSKYPYKELILELLEAIEQVQKFGGLLSTHIYGREQWVNPVTKRIHAHFTQWTETARLNSSKPNGQNVPRKDTDPFLIRNVYQAAKGKVLLLFDYAAFELRLIAWASGDKTMLEIFNNNGDMHTKTAATLTGKKEEDVTKLERMSAKSGNFGIGYCGTAYALQRTYRKFGLRHTLEFCNKVVNAVKLTYPGIEVWQDECKAKSKKTGYAETIFGYRRVLPYINNMNRQLRSADERRSSNTPIQGSAADIMKRAQNSIYDLIARDTYLKKNGFDSIFTHDRVNQIQQFHDELVIELDNDKELILQTVEKIKSIMEKEPLSDFPLKLVVDTEIATSGWGDKQSFNEWLKSNSGDSNEQR